MGELGNFAYFQRGDTGLIMHFLPVCAVFRKLALVYQHRMYRPIYKQWHFTKNATQPTESTAATDLALLLITTCQGIMDSAHKILKGKLISVYQIFFQFISNGAEV